MPPGGFFYRTSNAKIGAFSLPWVVWALIEEGCLIGQDDSGHDRMDDLRIGRETLLSLP